MGSVQIFHPPTRSAADNDPPEEWLEILEEHRGSLRRLVAAKMNGEGEAAIDDVMQELAIATQANGLGSVERSKVGGWLRQVATRKVQDYWRREGRRRSLHGRLIENSDPAPESAVSPYEWVVSLERSQAIAEALGGLDGEDRAILEQKYLHGRSYEEIAHASKLSIKAVEYRLARARQAMRRRLHPDLKVIPGPIDQ